MTKTPGRCTVAELWRYPVKGMRGERCAHLTLDAYGVAGDRRFTFRSTAAPIGKPMLHSRERARLLLYTPGTQTDGSVVVTTPTGECFPLISPELLQHLSRYVAEPGSSLTLEAFSVPQTDVRPVALHTRGALQALITELGKGVDPRRFRSNLILNCEHTDDAAARGSHLRVPSGAALRLLEPIPRCRIVSLSPESALAEPKLLPHLARHHGGRFGVYAAVAAQGRVHEGDVLEITG